MLDPSHVKTLRVHPGLGVARVGNAQGPDNYFLAAEVPGATPSPVATGFRDENGRIRRQAIRFRIYAEMVDGTIKEITADDGVSISWTVEIANLKAGWYSFENAMDLPSQYVKMTSRRNSSVQGPERGQLDISPGPRTISGRNREGVRFDTGSFFGRIVDLGELRTDSAGRLVFLGGRGVSEPQLAGAKPKTFANNDGWHDDVSDGPIFARIQFADGQFMEAEPGYVVTAPPNYAPGLFGVVTMLDVVDNLFAGKTGADKIPCRFSEHIWPIFRRMTDLQWTNHGLYMLSGTGSPLDAHDGAVIERLRDPRASNAAFRTAIFRLFRSPEAAVAREVALLAHYGDYYGDYGDVPGTWLAITPLMHRRLEQWMEGNFTDDWAGEPRVADFDSLSPAGQVHALDTAGLFECLGGPFHPGIEMTWCMRLASIWKAPYRLNVLSGVAKQDYGPVLSREVSLGSGGPHDGVAAGSLTRWLGVPWQTDEASCLSDLEYEPSTYLSFPSFWGARVPNRVLSIEAWGRVAAPDISNAQALKHFSWREDWLRDLKGDYLGKINRMVSEWWQLGILEEKSPTPEARGRGLTSPAWVETGRPADVTGSNSKVALAAAIEALDVVDPAAAGNALEAMRPHVPPRRRLRRDEI